jgi:thiamine pyrophosphokinase
MPPSHALLVANGAIRWTGELAAMAAAAEPLLAADGGANRLGRLGLRPVAVIGDLDSIAPGTRAWLGEERMVHRPDQNRTDLDKAVEYALDELGVGRLTVLGATGGRIDHAVGNLGLLARRALGADLVFAAADHRVVAVTGELALEAVEGEIWSFFTFDPGVRVTLGGVRWPVDGLALDVGAAPSISNRASADRVTVHATGGAVVVVRWLSDRILTL